MRPAPRPAPRHNGPALKDDNKISDFPGRFIGRKKELALLEDLHGSGRFEMLILHGARWTGKSYLLARFASMHPASTVFFTAGKGGEARNVQSFCAELSRTLRFGEHLQALTAWREVFSCLDEHLPDQRLAIIIDEFTRLMASDKGWDSKLQIAIDRILRRRSVFLILSSSDEGAVEDAVFSASSPLYGRMTAQLRLEPFGYREARGFFPRYGSREALEAYCVMGGTPCCL